MFLVAFMREATYSGNEIENQEVNDMREIYLDNSATTCAYESVGRLSPPKGVSKCWTNISPCGRNMKGTKEPIASLTR